MPLRIAPDKVLQRYYITEDGRVWRHHNNTEVPQSNKSGTKTNRQQRLYKKVTLCEKSTNYSRNIHTLMKYNFFSKRDWCKEIHHRDHNPANNHLSNLQALSKKDHAAVHRLHKLRVKNLEKVVKELDNLII